jgi:hypothetical protein
MSCAQRPVTGAVKRVFNIDISKCEKCQKRDVTIIACITQLNIIIGMAQFIPNGTHRYADELRNLTYQALVDENRLKSMAVE